MHPATGPVTVADPAPVPIFGDDFQRHVSPFEYPVDLVAQRRAAAHVALISFQRHKAWQGQVGFRAAFLIRVGGGGGVGR